MFRILITLITTTFLCQSAVAQWTRNLERDGPPPEPVLEHCETAKDCIRLSDESANEFDDEKTLEYMKNAASMGSSDAQFKLAELYDNGIQSRVQRQLWGAPHPHGDIVGSSGVSYNSYLWYRIAALNNNNMAIEKLNKLTLDKINLRDREVALISVEIGQHFATGKALPKDYEKAINYYYLSIDQGYNRGYEKLAELYEFGHGVEQDLSKAREFYTISVDDRSATIETYLHLTLMLVKGIGGDIDLVNAYKWLYLIDRRWLNYLERDEVELVKDTLLATKEKMTKDQIEEGIERAWEWLTNL